MLNQLYPSQLNSEKYFVKHAISNTTKEIGINFDQLNLNSWSILILKKLHLTNTIKVKNTNDFITIIKFDVTKGPCGPPKKIIDPKTEIPKRCTYSAK